VLQAVQHSVALSKGSARAVEIWVRTHSGHLNVYLSASGCALSFVDTRLVTVPPRHHSKYLEPVNGNIELPAPPMDRGVRTQQSMRTGQQTPLLLQVRSSGRKCAASGGNIGCKIGQFRAVLLVSYSLFIRLL